MEDVKSMMSVVFHLHYFLPLTTRFFSTPPTNQKGRRRARGGYLIEVENHGLHGITDAHGSSTFYLAVEPFMHSNYCAAAVQRIIPQQLCSGYSLSVVLPSAGLHASTRGARGRGGLARARGGGCRHAPRGLPLLGAGWDRRCQAHQNP